MAPPTPVKRIYTLCCTLVSKDFTFMSCRPSSCPPPPPKTFNFVRLSEPSQAQSMCTVCTSCVALCQTLKEKVENQKRKKICKTSKKCGQCSKLVRTNCHHLCFTITELLGSISVCKLHWYISPHQKLFLCIHSYPQN